MEYVPLDMQFRDKRSIRGFVWATLGFIAVFVALVVSFSVPGMFWLPFVLVPVLVVSATISAALGMRKQATALSRTLPHVPSMLRGFGKPQQQVGLPGQQGLKRFASLAWHHLPGQEWNYHHGTYRDRFFGTFSFYGYATAPASEQFETFHVAYIDADPGPTVHIANSRGELPLDLRLSKRVSTESHEFNERWIAYARDPAAAHAVLSPRVMELLTSSRLEARAWVIENGAVAMVGTREIDPSNVAAILDELHALAGALPGRANQGR